MTKIECFAAALLLTGCAASVLASDAKAANTAEKTAAPAATKPTLVRLENRVFHAWKSKDARFWDTFLSDKFVGYGLSAKLDKASATNEYTGNDCEINSYALSDEQMRRLGERAALLTYKTSVDGTCGGQEMPANSRAASIYVWEGGQWRSVFHAESPIVDPTAAAKPVANKEAPRAPEAKPAARDAATDAMLAVERTVWEDWREHDAQKIADLTAKDISFINIFGSYLATKADALKDWSGTACDIKRVSVTDAAGTMLSPRVGILTFTATADGTCNGQVVNSVIWGTSVYVKDGAVWKWAFGINTPARRTGA